MAELFWKKKIGILKSNILSLNKKNIEITKVIDRNYKNTVKKSDKRFIKNYNKRHLIFLWITILSGPAAIALTIIAWLYSEKSCGSGLGIIAGIIASVFITLLIQTITEYDKIKTVLTLKKKYLNNISSAIEPVLSDLLMFERGVGKNIDCSIFQPSIRVKNKIIDINPANIAGNYALLDEVIKRKLLDSPSIKTSGESFINCIQSYKRGSKEKYFAISRELYIIEKNILQDNTLYSQKIFSDVELLALGKLRFSVEQMHTCHCNNDFHLANSLIVGMVQAINLFVSAGLDITQQIYRYCGKEKINTYNIAAFSFKDIINNMDDIRKRVAELLDESGIRKADETESANE